MSTVTVELDVEKATKNTLRFTGQNDHLNMVYLPKSTVAELGAPRRVEITIRAIAA